MRLLHPGHDGAGAGAARAQPVTDAGADSPLSQPQPLPLRHAHAHRARGGESGAPHESRGACASPGRRQTVSGPLVHRISRRDFLATGGALIVSFSLPSSRAFGAEAESAAKPKKAKLPGSLEGSPLLDSWIRIAADGTITVFTGKVELGQGIRTALLQVAAEELMVEPHTLTLVTADTSLTPDERYTAGSQSMQDSATAVRNAASQVRALLLGMAAHRFE